MGKGNKPSGGKKDKARMKVPKNKVKANAGISGVGL